MFSQVVFWRAVLDTGVPVVTASSWRSILDKNSFPICVRQATIPAQYSTHQAALPLEGNVFQLVFRKY